MATVTEVVDFVLATLQANMPEIDAASNTSFMPVLESANIAVMGVPFGHVDEGFYYSQGWMHVVHRLRFLVWFHLVQGDEEYYHTAARDFGYKAMKVLVGNDVAGGYTLHANGEGSVITYSVEPNPIVEGGLPYLVGILTVPVRQKEVI